VVRALPGLGDLLCSVPLVRSLRQAFPLAHITWLGLPGTKWFGQRFAHLLDSWLPFPGFPGIPEGWQTSQATINFLQQRHGYPYDLVWVLPLKGYWLVDCARPLTNRARHCRSIWLVIPRWGPWPCCCATQPC
jgi:hypothetical protein